jgi:hypothetical protein
MEFVVGATPVWKGKPKSSPLDTDTNFQKLVNEITSGVLKADGPGAGLYVQEIADGERLRAKNPARMVRDALNRILKEQQLEESYNVTCRQTVDDGVWAVWVTRLHQKK